MRQLAILTIVAALAGRSWAAEDASIPSKSVEKLSELIQDYFQELDSDSYRKAGKELDKIRKELESVEKKVEEPLKLVADWREILKGGGLLPKTPIRVSANAKFSRTPVAVPSPLPWRPQEKEAERAFDGELKAHFSVPRDYKKVAYPVIIALHPQQDESGADFEAMETSDDMADRLLEWAEATYPEDLRAKAIVVVPIMDYIALSPTGDTGERPAWSTLQGATWAISALRTFVFQSVNYDSARIFLDGHDGGGTAAVSFCAQFPSLLTGAIVRGPTPTGVQFANCQYNHMLFVGDDTKAFHDSWAGEGFPIRHVGEATTEEVVGFLEGAEKNYCPDKVQMQTLDLAFGSAYWLQITDFDWTLEGNEPAQILAEVDKEKNEITVVTSPRVKSFTIYLNDALLDLDQEFRILHRAESPDEDQEEPAVRFAGTRARSLQDTLQLAYSCVHGNPGEMYVASITVDL